jgi:SAM-dependent methyltransferase
MSDNSNKLEIGPQQGFWDALSNQWSEANKDVLVGWYEQHNQFEDYETVLWDGIEREGKSALEYGCGPGRNAIRFYKNFAQIDGVDHAANIVEKANGRIAEQLGVPPDTPNLPRFYHNNGFDLAGIESESYDIVFSVIAMQHINARPKRVNIWKEAYRVLKPGGWFTAQMGFGPGHHKSVDYYNEVEVADADARVEDPNQLKADFEAIGFTNFRYELREPNHDCHPQWIWFKAQK